MAIDKFVGPLRTRGVEVDGPHTAESEAEVIRASEALCWRCAPGGNQWSGSNAWECMALISAVNTWTDFDYWTNGTTSNAPYIVPYRMTEGFDRILGVVSVVTALGARLQLRLVVDTLIDAVTETNGGPTMRFFVTEPLRQWNWALYASSREEVLRRTSKLCYVTPTDYSAPEAGPSRVMGIKPQVKIAEDAPFDAYGVGTTATAVSLQSVDLIDVPEATVGI